MTKKGNLQQGAFHLEKGKKLEWLMAVILLSAAYVLSREGARLVAAQKAATKVVVLDSGHGGDDPGKIGANGVKEKDINLAIARLLKKKLEKQGILVVMTREGEDDLSDPGAVNAKVQDLQRRVQLIHKKKPDCVISIHQHSNDRRKVTGAVGKYSPEQLSGGIRTWGAGVLLYGFKRRRKTGALHAGCTGRGARSGESQESQGKQNVLHAEEDRRSAGDLRVRIPLKSGGGSAPEHKGVPEKGGGCTV